MVERPVFVVGTGRCGTYSMCKALSQLPGLEVHHEYHCELVQKIGCLYHAGHYSLDRAVYELRPIYQSAVWYGRTDCFVDVSNKASWLVEPLAEMFPEARFLWLVRDLRLVVLSYFHKLEKEHYRQEDVRALLSHLNDPRGNLPPPLEKAYWWPIPRDGERHGFPHLSRWHRVCWHANEVCQVLSRRLGELHHTRSRVFRLEHLAQGRGKFFDLLRFAFPGQDWGKSNKEAAWQTFKKPSNVHRPEKHEMTPEQEWMFRQTCGTMHELLGYGWEPPEEVKYDEVLAV